jgi:hypothetical protein
MAKKKRSKSRPKAGASAKSNRKLEALRRAQKIDEILLMGNVQSQAGSDSAAEERPAGESHIVDLLESQKLSAGRNVFERQPQRKAPRKRRPRAPKRRNRPKKARRKR